MLRIQEVKTKLSSRSVQVIRFSDSRRTIIKHIGTGNSDEEIESLKEIAWSNIEDISQQTKLFTETISKPDNMVSLSQCEYIGLQYGFLYDVLKAIQVQIGYTTVNDTFLTDLVIIRIVEPASRLRSIELLEMYFGIRHRRQRYYEPAPQWLSLKGIVEKTTLSFVKKEYNFDFSLLFYDVTT